MRKNFINSNSIKVFLILLITLSVSAAQNRGNRLNFQGIMDRNYSGIESHAMGNAYTAMSGNVESIFFNPAGLIGLEGITFALNANSMNKKWFERQDYRPNRQLVTASFILDGLYTPSYSTNGMLDYEAFLQDTANYYYQVLEPELGKDPHKEESADWVKEFEKSGFNNLMLAIPFSFSGKRFVISGAYSVNNIYNYDRNETYLNPHFTDDKYNAPDRVTQQGDSVRINWFDFERFREGTSNTINLSMGMGLNKFINIGIGFENFTAETDDFQKLDKIGHFDIIDNYNTYKFSYDTTLAYLNGISEYSYNKLNLGVLFNYKNISIGARLTPGYDIERQWNYEKAITDSVTTKISGDEKLEIPFSFSLGFTVKPVENLIFSIDYHANPYQSLEFENNNSYNIPKNMIFLEDTTTTEWENRNYFAYGIKYDPWKYLSLLGGYKGIPNIFIPDGNAIKERGPITESYSLGLHLGVYYGTIQLSYEYRKLKYYDIYFSNTNYCTEEYSNIKFGYVIEL